MYVVIDEFNDLEDEKHKYKKNDIFPYDKKEISKERILELSSKNNKLKKELIKKVELNDMSIEQLLSYAKREEIDLKSVILDALQKDNSLDKNQKELKKLKKVAKKMKLDFTEDIEIEELKKLIESKENGK